MVNTIVDTAGRYALYRWASDGWHTVVAPTASGLVDTSFGNRLRVETRGTQASLYIDDTLLTTAGDGHSLAGDFGLFAGSYQTGGFESRATTYRVERLP